MVTNFRGFKPRSVKQFYLAILICVVGVSESAVAGENWSSFQNGGHFSIVSTTLSPSDAIDWTAEIHGYGQSSPVSWGEKVYVTSVSGENKEALHVTAFAVETGEQLWTHESVNATPQESNNYVSKAAPTPVVDAAGVICFFEGGNLLSLTHTGEVRWQRNLVEEYGAVASRHGLSSSLEQSEKIAFVWVERQEEPYLLAINKTSGENIWKVPGLGVTSWSSPRLVPVEGGSHLVLSGTGMLVGLDPTTGERLWTFDEISGNSTPTPVPVQEGQFLIGATVGRGDSDVGRAAKSNGIISLQKEENGKWQTKYLWQSKRATTSFGSPIAVEGYCYFINRSGVMYCLDAATGKEEYAERVGGSSWATPFAAAGQLILPLKDGKLVIVTAGKKFSATSEFDVFPPVKEQAAEEGSPFGGTTLYAGILTNSRIILRSGDKLYCLKTE